MYLNWFSKGAMFMSDKELTLRVNKAVERAIEKKRINNAAVVVYDRKSKEIYNVLENGDRVVIGKRLTRGRYSELNQKV